MLSVSGTELFAGDSTKQDFPSMSSSRFFMDTGEIGSPVSSLSWTTTFPQAIAGTGPRGAGRKEEIIRILRQGCREIQVPPFRAKCGGPAQLTVAWIRFI
jgi:hypothetical protein